MNYAWKEINGNLRAQGQDCMLNVITHPGLVAIIFGEWPKICGAMQCQAATQPPYDFPILADLFELHRTVWRVVELIVWFPW